MPFNAVYFTKYFYSWYKSSLKTLQILFARAEALHAHGHTKEACRLAQRLAEEMLDNPPDLLAESASAPSPKCRIYIFLKSHFSGLLD